MQVFDRAKAFLKKLWSAAPVATTILALALAASVVFGVRSAIFWHTRPPWVQHEQTIEPWMTPGYIVRAWKLPRSEFLAAIDAPMPPPNGPMNLAELATYRSVPLAQIIAEAEAFIATVHPEPDPQSSPPND